MTKHMAWRRHDEYDERRAVDVVAQPQGGSGGATPEYEFQRGDEHE